MAMPGAWAAIRLTLVDGAVAAVINAVMGTALAWVLVRYRFPGRRVAVDGRRPAARDPDARDGA